MNGRSMLTIVLVLIVSTISSSAQERNEERDEWKGSGWYITSDFFFSVAIVSGPYSTKEICMQAKKDEANDCNFYGSQAAWDSAIGIQK